MVPVSAFTQLSPDDAVGDQLDALLGSGLGRLTVVADGRVVGLLSQTDVIRHLQWSADATRPVRTAAHRH